MNQRRPSANSATNPSVIATSCGPTGRPSDGDTDGKTTSTRSRKIATRPKTATTTSGPWRCGGRPVSRFRRYAKGMSQPTTHTTQVSVSHGWAKNRWTKNRVSTGTFPYQMTRYWEKKKYIQKIDIANCSFATSWTAAGGMDATPRALARTVRIDSRQKVVY